MNSIVNLTLATSKEIKNNRNPYSVLAKCQEELGEMATEVAIAQGDSYKKPDADGVIGEAVDLILATLDLIYLQQPDITEEELAEIATVKLAKWKAKVAEHMEKNNE